MGKAVYIAEKPSVAQEFAKALKLMQREKTDIWNRKKRSLPGVWASGDDELSGRI
ncbi:MAG: hypothetical protein V8S14_03625 [Lachnospiraceae bacterium]